MREHTNAVAYDNPSCILEEHLSDERHAIENNVENNYIQEKGLRGLVLPVYDVSHYLALNYLFVCFPQ